MALALVAGLVFTALAACFYCYSANRDLRYYDTAIFWGVVAISAGIAWLMLLVLYLFTEKVFKQGREGARREVFLAKLYSGMKWAGLILLLACSFGVYLVLSAPTAFDYAQEGRKRELVAALDENPEKMGWFDKRGHSLLFAALSHEQWEIAELLLDKRADLSGRVDERSAALSLSIGKPPVLERLLELGLDPDTVCASGGRALHYAVELGANDAVGLLQKYGADIDVVNGNFQTPLMLAVLKNDVESVAAVCRYKPNPDIPDLEGDTPLHWAVRNRNLKVMRVLIDGGASLKVFNFKEKSPLHLAVEIGWMEGAALLAEQMVELDLVNKHEMTPLDSAMRFNRPDILRFLLQNGADVNRQDSRSGTTPLHLAVYYGLFDAAKILIEGGANPELADHRGRTPLDMMRKRKVDRFLGLVEKCRGAPVEEPRENVP